MTRPFRDVTKPEAGHFALRLVKRGPRVPCRLVMEPPRDPETGEVLDRSWRLVAYVGIERADDPEWVDRIWWYGEMVDEAEYLRMLAVREWAVEHAPDQPEADYRRRVDLKAIKPLF